MAVCPKPKTSQNTSQWMDQPFNSKIMSASRIISHQNLIKPVQIGNSECLFTVSELIDFGAADNFIYSAVLNFPTQPLSTSKPWMIGPIRGVSVTFCNHSPQNQHSPSGTNPPPRHCHIKLSHSGVFPGCPFKSLRSSSVNEKSSTGPCTASTVKSSEARSSMEILSGNQDLKKFFFFFRKTKARGLFPHPLYDYAFELFASSQLYLSPLIHKKKKKTLAMDDYITEARNQGYIHPSNSHAFVRVLLLGKERMGTQALYYHGLNQTKVKFWNSNSLSKMRNIRFVWPQYHSSGMPSTRNGFLCTRARSPQVI